MRRFLKVCAAASLLSSVKISFSFEATGGSASAHTGRPLRPASKDPQIRIQHLIQTGFSEATDQPQICLANVQSSELTSQ